MESSTVTVVAPVHGSSAGEGVIAAAGSGSVSASGPAATLAAIIGSVKATFHTRNSSTVIFASGLSYMWASARKKSFCVKSFKDQSRASIDAEPANACVVAL